MTKACFVVGTAKAEREEGAPGITRLKPGARLRVKSWRARNISAGIPK